MGQFYAVFLFEYLSDFFLYFGLPGLYLACSRENFPNAFLQRKPEILKSSVSEPLDTLDFGE